MLRQTYVIPSVTVNVAQSWDVEVKCTWYFLRSRQIAGQTMAESNLTYLGICQYGINIIV